MLKKMMIFLETFPQIEFRKFVFFPFLDLYCPNFCKTMADDKSKYFTSEEDVDHCIVVDDKSLALSESKRIVDIVYFPPSRFIYIA